MRAGQTSGRKLVRSLCLKDSVTQLGQETFLFYPGWVRRPGRVSLHLLNLCVNSRKRRHDSHVDVGPLSRDAGSTWQLKM